MPRAPRINRRECGLLVMFILFVGLLVWWQWKAAAIEINKSAVRRQLPPRDVPSPKATKFIDDDQMRENTLSDETCRCPKDCIDYNCDGTKLAQGTPAMLSTLSFARCTSCTRMGKAKKCGSSKWMTRSEASRQCGTKAIAFSTKIRHCLAPNVTVPNYFAVDIDHTTGQHYATVKAQADRSTEAARASQLRMLLASAKQLEDDAEVKNGKPRDKKDPPPYRFIDFGVPDNKLAAQLSSAKGPAGNDLFTIEAYPLTSESRQLTHLTGCLNKAYNMAQIEFIAQKSLLQDWDEDFAFAEANETISSDRPVILRIDAPGYDLHFMSVFLNTIDKVNPVVIMLTPTVVDSNGEGMGKALIERGYKANNILNCFSTDKASDLWRLNPRSLSAKGMSVMWARDEDKRVLKPQCDNACIDLKCVDGWRSEYFACDREPICGAHEGTSGCSWNNKPTACNHDNQFPTVLSCSKPDLPVPRFSVIHTLNMQVMCQGEHDCSHVNKDAAKADIDMLKDVLNHIEGKVKTTKAELVDIGSFVGLVPFGLAKAGFKTHLFEAAPANRHLLYMTACYLNMHNAKVYDVAVGPADEVCRMPPSNAVESGKATFSCSSAPSDNGDEPISQHIPVQFKKLSTIFQQHFQGTKKWPGVLRFNIASQTPRTVLGGKQWLCHPTRQPVLIMINFDDGEVVEKANDWVQMFDMLQECGFSEVIALTKKGASRDKASGLKIENAKAFAKMFADEPSMIQFSLENMSP